MDVKNFVLASIEMAIAEKGEAKKVIVRLHVRKSTLIDAIAMARFLAEDCGGELSEINITPY